MQRGQKGYEDSLRERDEKLTNEKKIQINIFFH